MLELKNVTKKYGDFCAVKDLSFKVEEGKIVGLIGPNGAGKSTTIRMIMNIINPNSGEIILDGQNLTIQDKDKIGYLPEERGLYKKETVVNMLTYLASLKGMSKQDINKEIDKWLKKFGLFEWKYKKLENLSKGMSQKIQFISTILHNPKIIFLDEPFSGLDPVSSDELLSIIKELKQDGRIILFSTHIMETAELICDHIVMINHGQKILDGTLQEIRQQFGSNSITIECNGQPNYLQKIQGIIDVKERGNQYDITFDINIEINDLLIEIITKAKENNCLINSYKVSQPSLHSIFVSLANEKTIKSLGDN
ncbi:MAG: ATP-binding cassette domain-containing protein [Bacteroidales bacterium]|nr:ATP-binding cassette domain-containing protein [Bacteroidales bacterium]